MDLQDCSHELQYGVGYRVELDEPEQRAALISLYSNTNGPFWTWSDPIPEDSHQLFLSLITDVIEVGEGLSDPALRSNYSTLFSTLSASDLATLTALSSNCQLQQQLGFGQLLLKHDWGEVNQSYCQWHGEFSLFTPAAE